MGDAIRLISDLYSQQNADRFSDLVGRKDPVAGIRIRIHSIKIDWSDCIFTVCVCMSALIVSILSFLTKQNRTLPSILIFSQSSSLIRCKKANRIQKPSRKKKDRSEHGTDTNLASQQQHSIEFSKSEIGSYVGLLTRF